MSDEPETTAEFLTGIERHLASGGDGGPDLQAVLDAVLRRFECVVGTIHYLDPASGLLTLAAQRGIPDAILSQVQAIPVGKGMAGLAAARREPVQVCNLQADASGAVRPGAKETRMEGSVAVPMLRDGELRGVLGVAKPVVYEFSLEETVLLQQTARLLAERMA